MSETTQERKGEITRTLKSEWVLLDCVAVVININTWFDDVKKDESCGAVIAVDSKRVNCGADQNSDGCNGEVGGEQEAGRKCGRILRGRRVVHVRGGNVANGGPMEGQWRANGGRRHNTRRDDCGQYSVVRMEMIVLQCELQLPGLC